MRGNRILGCGAVLGGLAVGLGAFGAHGLAKTLAANGERAVAAWDTAAQYHLVMAAAVMICGLAAPRFNCSGTTYAASFFGVGCALFSGSLYGWSISQWKPLVFVTPIGGLCMILGFVAFAWTAFSSCTSKSAS